MTTHVITKQIPQRSLRLVLATTALVSVGLFSDAAFAADYDLVIQNGRVMDPESNFDDIRNVGITDGKITAITTDAITGTETIDATGHVVSPGFIDGHSHVVDMPLGQKAGLRDGLTSIMDLETGAWPVDTFYNSLEGKSQLNFGATVSLPSVRANVFNPAYVSESGNMVYDLFTGGNVGTDWSVRIASDDEMSQILSHMEDGLKLGGLGVGAPPGYATLGMTTYEVAETQRLVAKYGGVQHMHTRWSSQTAPSSAMLGFQEAIDPMQTYGGGVIIAHFTAQALALTKKTIDYVDDVRANGGNVMLEVYPYNYGAAGDGVGADYLEPDNYQQNMGRTYSDLILTQTGKPLDKEQYDKLVKDAPNTPVLFYNATEEDNLLGVGHPDILIGCDCFAFTDPETGEMVTDWDRPWESVNTHPRTSGAHAKVLRLVREGKVELTLMQAISKMSFLWADMLEKNGVAQMAFKGRMQVGADADITIFDPAVVTDNSKLEPGKNALPSTGIPYVVVNGTIVVKDSEVLKDVYPGQAIRKPIWN